jgi:hypothetical protein
MKLDDFLAQARQQLADFEAFWRAGMKDNPADFPEDLNPGDWYEQLHFYDQP